MRTFLRHAALWIGIYIVYSYMMSFYDDLHFRLIANLVNVPLFMAAYYLLKHVQIPYLYNRGQVGWFVVSFLTSSLVLSLICRCNGYLWMDAYFGRDPNTIPWLTPGAYLLKTVRFYTPAMALLAWESHQERRRELERMQQLEKEKIATELKFLKAQINPHFLFNTLNNLYAYVINQSPKAPDIIIQLSAILDYVLYKSQHPTVSLKEEIETIEHFLKLEQIRYGDRLKVEYQTSGNTTLPISPLILLSIVENAFKHGASGDIDQPKIKVDIKEESSEIHCEVWNTKTKYEGELNDSYKKGIGLSNIKRQLNLIYPNNHELSIQDLRDSFSVNLTIKPAL